MRGCPWAPLLLFVVHAPFLQLTSAKVVPFIQPGFSFDYSSVNETALQVPITSQCDTIRLKWIRGDAKGPAPVAPYVLHVLSSSSSTPFVIPAGHGPTFDWQVPFAPRTQYQICMYDTFGVSGGCQGVYTMVPPLNSNTTCQDISPSATLDVTLRHLSGPETSPRVPLVNQCSDLSIQPKSASPPFTLTVSPSLHPPVKITSEDMSPISWTVALPEGFPFFVSLDSADGSSWSNGPIYPRGSGSTDCLSPQTIAKNTFTFSTIGSSVGGLVLGIILGGLSTFLFFRRRQRTARNTVTIPTPLRKPEAVTPSEFSPGLPIQMPPRESTLPMSYPPPSLPNSPPETPERSQFIASVRSTSRSRSTHAIEPFTEAAPSPAASSLHFPLDVKRRTMDRQSSSQHMRAPSLTTQASSSQLTTVSSSNSSTAPLLPPARASRRSRSSRSGGGSSIGSSRLARAPTYVRHPPPAHMSVSDLITDDASLIAGNTVDDLPPQYMQNPREEEISVAGGRLI